MKRAANSVQWRKDRKKTPLNSQQPTTCRSSEKMRNSNRRIGKKANQSVYGARAHTIDKRAEKTDKVSPKQTKNNMCKRVQNATFEIRESVYSNDLHRKKVITLSLSLSRK